MSNFIFENLFQPENLASLPSDDPLYAKGKWLEATFTNLVDRMRNPTVLNLPPINSLMALFWDLVGNKITPSAIGSAPTVSFWAEVHNDDWCGMVLCPMEWPDMLQKEPYMQSGALVFAASQAKDYWNRKMAKGEKDIAKNMKARAWSNEAELLHFYAKHDPRFKANEYQQQIMEAYPKGIASVAELHYIGRPYKTPDAPPFPVDVNKFNRRQ